jgi:hypothetical protein
MMSHTKTTNAGVCLLKMLVHQHTYEKGDHHCVGSPLVGISLRSAGAAGAEEECRFAFGSRQWGRTHIIDNWCASGSRVYPGIKVPQGWRRMPLEFMSEPFGWY